MKISTRSGRSHQERRLGHSLPIVYREGAKIGVGIGALLFGGVFAAFPVLFFVMSRLDNEPLPLPAYFLLAAFLVVGFGIMALGVSALLHKLELDISTYDVQGLRRSLGGTKAWRDALTRYRGVLGEEEYHSGGKNRASYTLHKVILKHATHKERDVLLYCSRRDDNHRSETESYAEQFNRPVLIDEGDGHYSERAPEDLNKSVAQLVEEGKIEVRFDPHQPPQGGSLLVEKQPDGYLFSHNYRRVGSVVTSLIFFALGVGLMYWYFGPGLPADTKGSPWVAAVVGFGFAVAGAFAVVFCLSAISRLQVQPEVLEGETKLFDWTMNRKTIAVADVEEVKVGKNKQGKRELRASGDRGSLTFGKQMLRDDELQFVRSAIIATLARTQRMR